MTVWGLCFNLQRPLRPRSTIPRFRSIHRTLNRISLCGSPTRNELFRNIFKVRCPTKGRKHQLCGFLRCTCQPTRRIDVRSTQSFSKVKRAIKLGYFFFLQAGSSYRSGKVEMKLENVPFFPCAVLQGKPLSEDVCCLMFVEGREKGYFLSRWWWNMITTDATTRTIPGTSDKVWCCSNFPA